MLEHTFIHLPKYGPIKERKLWENGVTTWDEFLDVFGTSPYHREHCSTLVSSKYALRTRDFGHFATVIPGNEMWRTFPHAKRIAYLDIETTGTRRSDYITVIGIYDGEKTKSYVHGQNLHEFKKDIEKFDMVATFNGSMFDLPFIMRESNVRLPRLHVDLRFLLASLDITGGLKKIEKKFGFEREDDLDGLTGYDAILLWRKYKKYNDLNALDTLIRYNGADVNNLEKLLVWAYNEKKKAFEDITRRPA
ncbi:ribonuclease H-like domain-containing protein [Candidatus Micrarchaeota archaeon]|nr:ribonuclease H-like domain-containing protein [Candidatus Micrarchaeota archaeon]